MLSSCVRIHGVLCISSSVFRNNVRTFIGRPEITVHGPCSSGRYHGLLEYDIAHFFISEFASSWSNRCHAWLPPHVVDDIIKYGCHFVAFGKHAENEWYTQFLIYGLPKYFVKEFNKGLTDEEKLLCSHHMKTSIFWAIQQNSVAHRRPKKIYWLVSGSALNFSLSGCIRASVRTSSFQKTTRF